MHVHDELVLQFAQDLPLVQHRVHALLCYYLRLVHHLQRVQLPTLFLNYLPHSTESSLPDDLFEIKQIFCVCHNSSKYIRSACSGLP